MRRALLHVSWLAAMCAIGCMAGEPSTPAPGNPDAQIVPDAPPPPPPPDAAPPAAVCRPQNVTGIDGHHKPGSDCMSGNCHGPAGGANGAPLWTVAGTIYTKAAGGTVLPYATITVTDANGVSLDLIAGQNGNFYTSAALTFPVKVYASECPGLQPMTDAVQYGSCNTCHTAANAAAGQIHLP